MFFTKHYLNIKEGDEFIIQTLGSNLKGISLIDEIDFNRTKTNNFYEILIFYVIILIFPSSSLVDALNPVITSYIREAVWSLTPLMFISI